MSIPNAHERNFYGIQRFNTRQQKQRRNVSHELGSERTKRSIRTRRSTSQELIAHSCNNFRAPVLSSTLGTSTSTLLFQSNASKHFDKYGLHSYFRPSQMVENGTSAFTYRGLQYQTAILNEVSELLSSLRNCLTPPVPPVPLAL